MVYNPNIPQPSDNLSVSQGDILGNFTALNTLFNGFNQITFNTTSAPSAPSDPVSILHTAASGSSSVLFNGKPVPFFINSVGDYPIMPDLKLTSTAPGGGYNQIDCYSFKIGPVLVNFGRTLQANSKTSYPFTFQTAFSTSVLYRGLVADSINQLSNSYHITATNSLSAITAVFTSGTSAGANSYLYFLAIGY